MGRIKIGSRVSTEAWRFDRKELVVEERWSFLHFGQEWLDSRVIETVDGKSGNKWLVRWDIDQEVSSWETECLFKKDDNTPLQTTSVVLNMEKPGKAFFRMKPLFDTVFTPGSVDFQ